MKPVLNEKMAWGGILLLSLLAVGVLVGISRSSRTGEQSADVASGNEPVAAGEQMAAQSRLGTEGVDPTAFGTDMPSPDGGETGQMPPPKTIESRRVESLLATGLPREEKPWADEKGQPMVPSPADGMIRSLAEEIATATGPEALTQAQSLLASDQEGVGQIGAELMIDQPASEWDDDLFRLVADNQDLAVPLYALQALRDKGMAAEYDTLRALLASRLKGADWAAILQQQEWTGTALRGLLDLARELGDADQRQDVISGVLEADGVDYGARMQALLELRELLPFEEYRQVVQNELSQVAGQEPSIWQIGLAQLLQRLEGPVEIKAGPQVMTPSDVELIVAREYPAMYEDLALHVEMLAKDPAGVFQTGVVAKLTELIQQARKYPLSTDQDNALTRIETLIPSIVESNATGLALTPPPGS
jgi:hypothetical protein